MASSKVKAKFQKTMKQRYGVHWTGESSQLLSKMRATCKANHGVEVPLQNKRIKAKATKTFKATYLARGAEIRAKYERTMLENYGVRHNMHVPQIFHQQQASAYGANSLRINGKEFSVRGAEGLVVKHLVTKLKIDVDCIETSTTKGVPTIPYKKQGKTHVYYPDILVSLPHRSVLIEVKSDYTAGLSADTDAAKSLFRSMRLKLKAAENEGFDVRLVICVKGKLVPVSNPSKYSRTELLRLIY